MCAFLVTRVRFLLLLLSLGVIGVFRAGSAVDGSKLFLGNRVPPLLRFRLDPGDGLPLFPICQMVFERVVRLYLGSKRSGKSVGLSPDQTRSVVLHLKPSHHRFLSIRILSFRVIPNPLQISNITRWQLDPHIVVSGVRPSVPIRLVVVQNIPILDDVVLPHPVFHDRVTELL